MANETPFAAQDLEHAIGRAIHKAKRDSHMWEATGDDDPRQPYRDLLLELTKARQVLAEQRVQIEQLRDHKHEWGSDHYCAVCGADGLV